MIVSVVNHTEGAIPDQEVQKAIRAINRQIQEDFAPYWGMSATLRLEGRSAQEPDVLETADLRGDAVIYLWNDSDVEGAIGYHFRNMRGIPYGFVFTEIARSLNEPWPVTLSHEALEMIADPEANLLVMGPHPTEQRDVFYWYEMCDAVQGETYEIDGVPVSNFLLPLYFTGTRDVDEPGARNDFLGTPYPNGPLRSFGINPGGYAGFFDPQLQDHDVFSLAADPNAEARFQIKGRAKEARRAVRYRRFEEREKIRHIAAHHPPRQLAKGGRATFFRRMNLRDSQPTAPRRNGQRTIYASLMTGDGLNAPEGR